MRSAADLSHFCWDHTLSMQLVTDLCSLGVTAWLLEWLATTSTSTGDLLFGLQTQSEKVVNFKHQCYRTSVETKSSTERGSCPHLCPSPRSTSAAAGAPAHMQQHNELLLQNLLMHEPQLR